jgi:hypothetical protein
MDGNGGPGRPPFRRNHGAIVHFSTSWPPRALNKKKALRGRSPGSKFRLPRPFGPWQGGANPRVVVVGGCFLPWSQLAEVMRQSLARLRTLPETMVLDSGGESM